MYWAINSNAKNIPWSALNISKSLLNLALIILEFIIVYPILFQDNQHAIYPMDIYSPIIKGVTYVSAQHTVSCLFIIEMIRLTVR